MKESIRKLLSAVIVSLALGVAIGWFWRGASIRDVIFVETENTVSISTQIEWSPTPKLSKAPQTAPPVEEKAPAAESALEKEPAAESTENAVELNSATVQELETLPGIGPVLAQRIIEYRETNNGFRSVEELMDIKGIGEKTYAKLVDYVEVR